MKARDFTRTVVSWTCHFHLITPHCNLKKLDGLWLFQFSSSLSQPHPPADTTLLLGSLWRAILDILSYFHEKLSFFFGSRFSLIRFLHFPSRSSTNLKLSLPTSTTSHLLPTAVTISKILPNIPIYLLYVPIKCTYKIWPAKVASAEMHPHFDG